MNESLFVIQVAVVFGFTTWLARQGKEWLLGWMGLLAIVANLFVTKQIKLFGLDVTASDVYMIGLFLSFNILQEFWGAKEGKQAIKATLVFQLFFLVISQLHLLLAPNLFDGSQQAFVTILGLYPRILFASLFTLWVVQKGDLWLFSKLKNLFPKLSFSLRNVISLSLSQALDTALFTLLALFGHAGNLVDIMVMSFVIKMTLILMTPFLTYPLRRYVIPV